MVSYTFVLPSTATAVVSGVPAHEGRPVTPVTYVRPIASGMALPCGSAMSMANEAGAWLRASGVAAAATRALVLPGTTPTIKQRDAFAGISPGLRSWSPPV